MQCDGIGNGGHRNGPRPVPQWSPSGPAVVPQWALSEYGDLERWREGMRLPGNALLHVELPTVVEDQDEGGSGVREQGSGSGQGSGAERCSGQAGEATGGR